MCNNPYLFCNRYYEYHQRAYPIQVTLKCRQTQRHLYRWPFALKTKVVTINILLKFYIYLGNFWRVKTYVYFFSCRFDFYLALILANMSAWLLTGFTEEPYSNKPTDTYLGYWEYRQAHTTRNSFPQVNHGYL